MLSSQQKNQKNSNSGGLLLADKNSVCVREASSNYELSRVAELWANLTMIQQMRGDDVWLKNSKVSGLSWNEYVMQLINSESSKVLIFEKDEIVFGFSYMLLENVNASKPNLPLSLKAIIKEIYLEPGFRKYVDSDVLAELMRNSMKALTINYFEVAVKDLDL